jgi:hypothetical protein
MNLPFDFRAITNEPLDLEKWNLIRRVTAVYAHKLRTKRFSEQKIKTMAAILILDSIFFKQRNIQNANMQRTLEETSCVPVQVI